MLSEKYFTLFICLGCVGNITLSSLAVSEFKYTIDSRRLQARGISKRKIKVKLPDSEVLHRFDVADVSGNCCWKVRSKYFGGESLTLSRAGAFHINCNVTICRSRVQPTEDPNQTQFTT